MGRAFVAAQTTASAARTRSRAHAHMFVRPLLLALLLMLDPPASVGAVSMSCPDYCICNVTVEVFYLVTCVRASLRNVPQELPAKPNTTTLDLHNNQLTILRENGLDNYSQLQILNLNNNQIKEIHKKAFVQCQQLRVVYLSHNQLKTLAPELFEKNRRLQFVDLSNNELVIPTHKPFLISSSLLILNLTQTRLEEVPPLAFSRMHKLQRLELRANHLKKIDVAAVSFLSNLTLLLSRNPLHCDCALWKTWRWHRSQSAQHVPEEESAICNEPLKMRGRSLDVMLEQLTCGEGTASGISAGMYALYAIAVVLLLVVVILMVLMVQLIRRRRQRDAKAMPAGAWRRPKRLAPPVGEYIEVLPDDPFANKVKTMEHSEPVYEALEEKKISPDGDKGSNGAQREVDDTQRYVTDLSRNTYVPPSVPPRSVEPIYVNMNGPPLPQRTCPDAPPAPDHHTLPLSDQHSPRSPAKLPRPCSIPLLEGCDFYEVVD